MNILIADDEPLIHISIEHLILSAVSDVAVFHAYNGREMLEFLSEHSFAIAYVDIKMPGISGLEALARACEISPHTSYYIMTSFDKFEYAKQAIKLKVSDYLMKPLDLKTLLETINTARIQMQSLLESRKNCFRNWLESTLNNRTSSFCEYTGMFCGLMLLTIDSSSVPAEDINIPFQPYDDNIVSVFTDDGLFLLCFSEKSRLIQEIFKSLSLFSFPSGITCFASSISNEPEDIKNALPLLVKYASLRVLLGLEHFYYLNPLQNTSSFILDFCQMVMQMQSAYIAKDYTKFSTICSLLISYYSGQEEFTKYSEAFSKYLCILFNLNIEQKTGLESIFEKAGKSLVSTSSAENKAQLIIRFIEEHYQDNISAADLSNRFGLSAGYISSLLKNTLGIRYNDYVTNLRLNHAKELLISTNMSIKEITAACGYYSQSHFTKLFLEHEKCTPLEYRKKIIRKSREKP